ncbi:alpha/beta fold hydrolase [Streptomyces sp. p1417]|uniref:Alpha/beta fold hydrolase n=1 Tax=Streptomyces typhae TaxID=2681492 RepID=A0A6L6WU45_9ACTN|nr:alpha/beta fold hydrolase [Streptomyces typhae]
MEVAVRSTSALTAATATATATCLALALPALPAAAATPAPGKPDLGRFYGQKIKWAACEPAAQNLPEDVTKDKDVVCGKVTVPLDYAHPGGDTLDLALMKVKASGDKRGSLLVNFGGPGGAGVSGLAGSKKDFGYVGKGYDVVGFDPRGVGLSEPVSCGGRPDPEGADGAEDAAALLKQLREAAARCDKESGPVLQHMGTVNVSRDLDVMRQALGDKKLNYLGFSYGTRLGAVYTAQFPKKVGRMVLDGVDTLTENVEEQGLVGAEGRQTALDNFLLWCTKNAGCVFGEDSRAARETMVKIVKDLDAYPLRAMDGQEFTGQDVVSVLGTALYSRQAWPALSQALGGLLADGDPRALLRMGGALGERPEAPQGARAEVPEDNADAALMAVNCADDPDRPDAKEVEREVGRIQREFEEASPVFGKSMLTPVLLCFGRPAGTDYIRDDVRDVDTPKFLLVGTRGDPATPYRWTEETAKRLGSSAVVLDNKGDGHTGYFGSKCVKAKVDAFLLYKEMPKNGSSCAAE